MKIHQHDEHTLETQFAGFHGLDYFFKDIDPQYHTWKDSDGFSETYLDYHMETADGSSIYFPAPVIDTFTRNMFGITFSDFKETKLNSNRGCRHTYSWRNLINLYFGGYFPSVENTLTVEIKGGYFEFINWDNEKQEQFASYADSLNGTAKNLHSFIDERLKTLKFDDMQKCVVNHWFHSKSHPTLWTGKTSESARGFQFGSDNSPRILKVYESGRYRRKETDQSLDYLRLEMKLRDEEAQAAYREWRSGKSIYQITLDRIAKQVEFIQPYHGKNKSKSRTSTAPWWKSFTESAVPFKLEKPKRDPNAIRKAESRLRSFKKYLTENDPRDITLQFLRVLAETTGGPLDLLSQEVESYFNSLQPT